MTVVDTRQMVEVGVSEEWSSVYGVHQHVEGHEGSEGIDEEGDAGWCQEGEKLLRDGCD